MKKQANEKNNYRILVVYYSKIGHTRKIAQDIAQQMDVDLEEITDLDERGGTLGFLKAIKVSITKKEAKISEIKRIPSKYDLVIMGSPIWGGNITPALRTYINKYGDSIQSSAFFVSSGGKTPDRIFESLLGLLKEKPVAMIGISLSELKDHNTYHAKLSSFIENIIRIKMP